MRGLVTLVVCLVLSVPAAAQSGPDTLAIFSGSIQSRFFVSNQVQFPQIAIRLPDSLSGKFLVGLRAYYLQGAPPDSVSAATWAASAHFSWTLSTGTSDQPTAPTGDSVEAPLSQYPLLRAGGWLDTPVEWPMAPGQTYWLIGHWHSDASYVRLGATPHTELHYQVGYLDGGNTVWQSPASWVGLMVQILYQDPSQGAPSGIFDHPQQGSGRGSDAVSSATLAGGYLRVKLASGEIGARYEIRVVNILGQPIVSQAGYADGGEIAIPWSGNRPSGVYLCRIRTGRNIATVPLVHLK